MNRAQQNLLATILLVSAAGVVGSLYFSNFGDPVNNIWLGELFNPANGLAPCKLCWWARILLYPITVISTVGLIRKDTSSIYYILPLSIPGIFLGMYHYAIQKLSFPVLINCSSSVPCTTIQVEYFGFITIPFLGFAAFAAITALAVYFLRVGTK